MTINTIILTLAFLFVVCPDTFGQKCKEGLTKVGVFTNRGGPKITRKPQPEYTEEARRHQIQGTVLFHALFHSSGDAVTRSGSGLRFAILKPRRVNLGYSNLGIATIAGLTPVCNLIDSGLQ